MSSISDYERGVKEGRVNALLDEHTSRLNKINGSIERHAKSNESLAKSFSVGFEKLTAEMRKMQEEARARELAVKVAAETLAAETERRRIEEERLREERAQALEVPARAWIVRANKATVVSTIVAFVLALITLYITFH